MINNNTHPIRITDCHHYHSIRPLHHCIFLLHVSPFHCFKKSQGGVITNLIASLLVKYYYFLDRYEDEKGDINYLRFHEEIENEVKVDYFPEYRFDRSQPTIEEQVEEIEKEIKKALIKYRIKLDESFRDYDRLRTGFITKAQFISTIGAIKFHKMAFNQTQLVMLAELK